MRRILLLLTLVGALLLACSGVVLAQRASPAHRASKHLAPPGRFDSVCSKPAKRGKASCLSKVRTDANPEGALPTLQNPSGYYPADLQSAYNTPSSTAGLGMTVAIVDAYDNPNAESDLQTYRSYFNLPPCLSTTGCFKKVDQRGGTSYPRADADWVGEISLDLDMVSAICPNCNILLVETDDETLGNLAAGVDEAAGLGANAISNSYGANEFSGETNFEAYYHHPGLAITASSGDSGYGVGYPAASQFVTAVGGTSLRRDGSTRGWSETVWSGAGSGCSAFISKPSWQTDGGCSKRTVADVAADADPNTGVAVYDSFGLQGRSGWFQFGGTSVSAPIVASIYALAGNTSSINDGSYPYSHTSALYDVTSGSNGNCTTGTAANNVANYIKKHKKHKSHVASPARGHKKHKKSPAPAPPPPAPSPPSAPAPPASPASQQYLCTGVPGYDGPTGNGTPNGTGAF